MRCVYCDTAYAFQGGAWMHIDEILREVVRYGTRHVTVTGGEPLAQRACLLLLSRLCDAGYDVSLETSGAIDIGPVDPRVSRVVDVKTPASGEVARNLWENLDLLNGNDEIKFVIVDENDYVWARQVLLERGLAERCPVLFSPVHATMAPDRLADWILRDRLPVRLQVQLHKILWGEARAR